MIRICNKSGMTKRAYQKRRGISKTRYIFDIVFGHDDFTMDHGNLISRTKNPNISHIMSYEIFSTKPFARHRTKSIYYKAIHMREMSEIGKMNKKKGLKRLQEDYDRAHR